MSNSHNILNFNLSQENTTPLYHQLFTLIKHEIQNGGMKPGDLLPSENELCSQYSLSRSTIRQALNQLVEEGLVIRRRGKGSFVATKKLNRNLNHLYNFTEDINELGLCPSSEVLESKVEEATDDIITILNLPEGRTSVYKLVRLRLANHEPLLIETTYIPLYLCPDIINENFSNASLYNFLKTRYHLNFHRAIETYESVILDIKTAKLLNCKASSSAFKIQRIAYLDSGIALELTNSYHKGNACKFKVELLSNQGKVTFSRQTTL
jgi:GntR family transcriptional regulator